jgi:hypothetical protein
VIFNLYPRVVIKAGDERYEFDRSTLMFREVVEIEKASGWSFGEWQTELGRYSLQAIGALVHVLRKRAGEPSDFAEMNFPVDGFDVVPLHDDGSEFTAEEVAADITKRVAEAENPVPTIAAPAAGQGTPEPGTTPTISRTLPSATTSGPGNSNGSRGGSSRSSRKAPTPS